MERVTKTRINAIYNAGSAIETFDFQTELSDKEIEEHHIIGKLLIDHANEVLKLLIKLNNGRR